MYGIKKFTQSITTILVVVLTLAFTFTVARIMQVTGLVGLIDSLYQNQPTWFWVTLVASRLIYVLLNGFGLDYLIGWLEDNEFFWFKKSKPIHELSESEDNRDMSGYYIAVTLFLVALIIIAEIVVRIITGVDAPYYQ